MPDVMHSVTTTGSTSGPFWSSRMTNSSPPNRSYESRRRALLELELGAADGGAILSRRGRA